MSAAPWDKFARMQNIMADPLLNTIIEASVNGITTREAFQMAINRALEIDDKRREIAGWRARVNLNSANDGEIKR